MTYLPNPARVDVAIIGAGVSGIDAAYRISTQAPPGTSFTILESRDAVGGTWDLFRYPGIRTDSDVFTYGFPWNPWPHRETMATGPAIRDYLAQSAKVAGVDVHIRFRHNVTSANWNKATQCWELGIQVHGDTRHRLMLARFLFLGTGYYDYQVPLQTVIPGIEKFQGKVIHPQFWPEDFDYTNKDIVVIGSGATSVTLVPSMASRAKHVTMLQRSPSYILPIPQYSFWTGALFFLLPNRVARWLNRTSWMLAGILFVGFCRTFPTVSRWLILRLTTRLIPPEVKCDPHFTPRYNPWEQRMGLSPGGDFYQALRSGKASVVTDTIDKVAEDAIKLTSGATLCPDVIVTATGLKIRFGGGIQFSVNNEPFDLTKKFAWKSSMLQDLPNVVFSLGYLSTGSWTLGADCAAQLLTRLMCELEKNSATVATPYLDDGGKMTVRPIMTLNSTYLQSVDKSFPKSGSGVWSPRSNYVADLYAAKWGDIKTGLLLT